MNAPSSWAREPRVLRITVKDFRPLPLPWQADAEEFRQSAQSVGDGGAVCIFLVDHEIPAKARGGYAALVIAYARADEPVQILDDGTAVLLIREGGSEAGQAVGRRVVEQMRRLSLETTLRAGVALLHGDVDDAVQRACATAADAPGGSVTVAP